MTRTRHQARLATAVFLRRGDDVLLLRHPEHKDRFPGADRPFAEFIRSLRS